MIRSMGVSFVASPAFHTSYLLSWFADIRGPTDWHDEC